MLKARARGKDGRPLYVLGLSQLNVAKLLKGRPIVFDGSELGLAGKHFLIAHAETNKQALALSKQHGQGDPRKLVALCLGRSALEQLRVETVELDGAPFKIDGTIMLVYGDTEQTLGAVLGFDLAPLPPGYRDDLDPLTGLVRRRRVEDA
jgi:hypothetical protein